MDSNLKLTIVDTVRAKFIISHVTEVMDLEHELQKWADYIYDVIAETNEFQQALRAPSPDYFLREISELDIKAVVDDEIVGVFGKPRPFTMNFSTPKLWVDITPVRDLKPLVIRASLPGGYPLLVLLEHPKWAELHKAVIAHNNIIKTSADMFQKVVTAIEKICDHFDTVNEAVAAWPALRYLLPEELQTQDLVFDGTPKPLPEDVDIAELTALITREKMGV